MQVREATEVAREWVARVAGQPGFVGALLHGSINWMPDEATLPATSDVDVRLVFDDTPPGELLGKRVHRGVLLDASWQPASGLGSPEAILGQHEIAGSFARARILADPSGALSRLQRAVADAFPRRAWVLRRIAHARDKALAYSAGAVQADAFHDRVTAWLFANGVGANVLLVAALRNPTVRRRYAEVRALLEEQADLAFHEDLLEGLGCREMSAATVTRHLGALGDAFDVAGDAVRSPFSFAADLGEAGRSVAIDGSRELVEAGLHREAIFWILATATRCQAVFHRDAPKLVHRFEPRWRELLADLGVDSDTRLADRAEQLRRLLPRIERRALGIAASHTGIID